MMTMQTSIHQNLATLENLPPEILIHHIFSHLGLRTLFLLAATSKKMRILVLDNKVVFRDRLFDRDVQGDRERKIVDDSYVLFTLLNRLGPRARHSIIRFGLDNSYITAKILLPILYQCPSLEELSIRNCRLLTIKSICEILMEIAQHGFPNKSALRKINIFNLDLMRGDIDATVKQLEITLKQVQMLKDIKLDIGACHSCNDVNELFDVGECIGCYHQMGMVCKKCRSRMVCTNCSQALCLSCGATTAQQYVIIEVNKGHIGFCQACIPSQCNICSVWQTPKQPSGRECQCRERNLCSRCDSGKCQQCNRQACSGCLPTWKCVCNKSWCLDCVPAPLKICKLCRIPVCMSCSMLKCVNCGNGCCTACWNIRSIPKFGCCDSCANAICDSCCTILLGDTACQECGFMRCQSCREVPNCYCKM